MILQQILVDNQMILPFTLNDLLGLNGVKHFLLQAIQVKHLKLPCGILKGRHIGTRAGE